jgi:hypothetical protein
MLKPEQSPTFKYTCPGAEAQRQVFFSSTHPEPSGSLFLPIANDDVGLEIMTYPRQRIMSNSHLGFDRLMEKLHFSYTSRASFSVRELNRRWEFCLHNSFWRWEVHASSSWPD